jgi:hypothetical protein
MRYLIERQSDRPGHLQRNGRPVSDQQLAVAAGCSSKKVARLLQGLVDVGLVERTDGCWVSGRLAALTVRRAKRRELTKAWRNAGGEARAVRRTKDRRARARGGVSRDTHCDQSVTDAKRVPPSSATSSPPHPLSISTSTPAPNAAHSARGGAAAEKTSAERAVKQPAEFRQLTDYWIERYAQTPGHEGVLWEFDRFDGVTLSALWQLVGFNLEAARGVVNAYLADRSSMYEGHPMNLFKRDMRKFIARASGAKGSNRGGSGTRPAAADRGEYESGLPVAVRRVS